jgi:hypothetical protein
VDGVEGRVVVLEPLDLRPLPQHGHQQAAHALDRRKLQLVRLKGRPQLEASFYNMISPPWLSPRCERTLGKHTLLFRRTEGQPEGLLPLGPTST